MAVCVSGHDYFYFIFFFYFTYLPGVSTWVVGLSVYLQVRGRTTPLSAPRACVGRAVRVSGLVQRPLGGLA